MFRFIFVAISLLSVATFARASTSRVLKVSKSLNMDIVERMSPVKRLTPSPFDDPIIHGIIISYISLF